MLNFDPAVSGKMASESSKFADLIKIGPDNNYLFTNWDHDLLIRQIAQVRDTLFDYDFEDNIVPSEFATDFEQMFCVNGVLRIVEPSSKSQARLYIQQTDYAASDFWLLTFDYRLISHQFTPSWNDVIAWENPSIGAITGDHPSPPIGGPWETYSYDLFNDRKITGSDYGGIIRNLWISIWSAPAGYMVCEFDNMKLEGNFVDDYQRYLATPFQVRGFSSSPGFSGDVIEIVFTDLDLRWTSYLLNTDRLGEEVTLYGYHGFNSEDKLSPYFRGYIEDWTVEGNDATLVVSSELSLWQKKVLRYPTPSCPWPFTSEDHCKYSGPETACDKSSARCVELGNYLNFGGRKYISSLENKTIYWGPEGT